MIKTTKGMVVYSIDNNNEIRYYVAMDRSFVESVENELIKVGGRALPLGTVVLSRSTWNFDGISCNR